MAKLSQAQIKTKTDEWGAVTRKVANAEIAKNTELRPFEEEFNQATEQIRNKHDRKLNSLREQADEIQDEIVAALVSIGKPIVISGELAEAVNTVKVGSRVGDAKKFFNAVKDRGPEFWACLKVEIAKAEKLIGANAVDSISAKPTKLESTLRLK